MYGSKLFGFWIHGCRCQVYPEEEVAWAERSDAERDASAESCKEGGGVGFRVQVLGCGVSCLGFEIWILGFGV